MKHTIIYSHGFGVRKDDRGLFTDIAAALPGTDAVMFDYDQFDQATNTLTATPLDQQAEKFRQKIAEARSAHPDSTIDLVCHSQGCVIAAMVQPKEVGKVIFLAPPDHFSSVDKKIEKMRQRPGTKVNQDGSVEYPRRDGSTTIIPKVFWDSRRAVDPMSLYQALASQTKLVIVQADQDEVIGSTDFTALAPHAKIIHMNTGHDFQHEARNDVAATVAKELAV